MTKLSKDKMKSMCQDVLSHVLTTAANNLVMEAAIYANSAGTIDQSMKAKLKRLYISFKDLFADSTAANEDYKLHKEEGLTTYIKAINGELHRARSQAVIYIDTLVIDPEIKN